MIIKESEEVAKLTSGNPKQWPCDVGSSKDTTHWIALDFDVPLKLNECEVEP